MIMVMPRPRFFLYSMLLWFVSCVLFCVMRLMGWTCDVSERTFISLETTHNIIFVVLQAGSISEFSMILWCVMTFEFAKPQHSFIVKNLHFTVSGIEYHVLTVIHTQLLTVWSEKYHDWFLWRGFDSDGSIVRRERSRTRGTIIHPSRHECINESIVGRVIVRKCRFAGTLRGGSLPEDSQSTSDSQWNEFLSKP